MMTVLLAAALASQVVGNEPGIPSGLDLSASFPVAVRTYLRGDAMVVADEFGNERTAFLHGLAAPDPRGPEEREAKLAMSYLRSLVGGRQILLVRDGLDPAARDVARYQAFVRRDGRWIWINAQMLRAGFAVASTSPGTRYDQVFRRHQSQAQAAQRGLWRPDGNPAAVYVPIP